MYNIVLYYNFMKTYIGMLWVGLKHCFTKLVVRET